METGIPLDQIQDLNWGHFEFLPTISVPLLLVENWLYYFFLFGVFFSLKDYQLEGIYSTTVSRLALGNIDFLYCP